MFRYHKKLRMLRSFPFLSTNYLRQRSHGSPLLWSVHPSLLIFLQSILYHPIVSVFHLCIACLYILSLNFFCLFHLKLYLTYLGKYLAFRQSSIHFTEWINKRMIIWMRYSFSYRRPASKIDIGGREEWLFFPKENLRFCFAREKKKVLLGKYKITDIP